MANIQLLQGTEKIKDSYGKINTSLTNLNNDKLERSGGTMTGILSIRMGNPSLILEDTNVGGVLSALTGYSGRLSIRLGANSAANEVLGVMTNGLLFPNNRQIIFGSGSPQGVVTAPPGSLYLNTSGGASTTIWVKESGTGNTGWVAK